MNMSLKHNVIVNCFERRETSLESEDLVGIHFLSGVNETFNGDANVILFVIDGIPLRAEEDPNDGYRSNLKEIIVDFNAKVSNTFTPVKVNITQDDDILIFTDIKSKKHILKIGTDYHDDYYPVFVGSWIPANMHVNKDKDD